METPTQKRTVQHIIRTNFDLLQDYHFDSITVQQICGAAEINRSTFYRYFEDKYDLLYHLAEELGEDITNEMQGPDEAAMLKSLVKLVNKNQTLFKHLIVSSKQNEFYQELTRVASRLIYQGAYEHDNFISRQIRQSIYPKMASDFFGSGIIEVMRQWLNNQYDYTLDEVLQTLDQIERK